MVMPIFLTFKLTKITKIIQGFITNQHILTVHTFSLQHREKLYSIELKEYVAPMLHSVNKLKASKISLCPGIHTLSKCVTPY